MIEITLEPVDKTDNIKMLINASSEEHYNFLKRLEKGLKEGTNTFESAHELLLCAKSSDGEIVAIGGIQADPYVRNERIGRVRHLYVHPDYRRHKVGKLILERLLDFSRHHFDEVRLKTPYEGYENAASKFYEANGFIRSYQEEYSHVYKKKSDDTRI
ncbi:MAG: GNAT family N-acetyltransferase [Erysipelothrix sp.]